MRVVHGLAAGRPLRYERELDPFRLSEAINYHLKTPAGLRSSIVLACGLTTFTPVFPPKSAGYLFRVLVRRAPATHQAGLVWQVKKPRT